MAWRTGNSSKEPAGPDGLEPEIKGAPRPSELWLSEVLWLTELVIHSSRSAERALKEDPVNARLLATFLLGIEVAVCRIIQDSHILLPNILNWQQG